MQCPSVNNLNYFTFKLALEKKFFLIKKQLHMEPLGSLKYMMLKLVLLLVFHI